MLFEEISAEEFAEIRAREAYEMGEKSGFAKGEQSGILETARKMKAEGIPAELIQKITNLSPEEYQN